MDGTRGGRDTEQRKMLSCHLQRLLLLPSPAKGMRNIIMSYPDNADANYFFSLSRSNNKTNKKNTAYNASYRDVSSLSRLKLQLSFVLDFATRVIYFVTEVENSDRQYSAGRAARDSRSTDSRLTGYFPDSRKRAVCFFFLWLLLSSLNISRVFQVHLHARCDLIPGRKKTNKQTENRALHLYPGARQKRRIFLVKVLLVFSKEALRLLEGNAGD